MLLAASLPAMAYEVSIEAPKEVRELLTEFLDLSRYKDREDLNPDQLNFMLATVAEQVRDLTATDGYFSPKTTVNVDRSGETPRIVLTVDPGPRTTVAKLDLDVVGAATSESPPQVDAVRKAWSLTEGDPFRQRDWAVAKQDGLRVLQKRRYAAARLAESQASIYPERNAAELSATYDSGPVFTLGDLNISGTRRYPDEIIRNVNTLEAGEDYSTERLLEFQRQVQRTPYFSNVVIEVDPDPAKAKQAPVNVRVTEFPTQRIRGGVGYATDTGARLEGRYTHLNTFGRAWVFDGQTRIEQRRQSGSVNLSRPPGRGGFVNGINSSFERTTLEGIDLRTRRLGVQRSRSTDEADMTYSVEYFRDDLRQLDGATLPTDIVILPGSHQALVAGVARTFRQVDDPSFPRSGRIVTLQGGVALKGLLTDQTFVRLYGRGRQYLPIGRSDLVIVRAELGAIVSRAGNAAIPASLLFRAGGTESVRGYAFQSIGNVRNGTVYPTRFVATAGVEYQRWLSAQWGAAVFYDLGTATDSWSGKRFFHAVGAGARYRSPVGPVNVDIAYGIQDRRLRPHVSLGVAF